MRSTRRLPVRFPDGAKYVLESDGDMVRRYVELPDGRRVHLARRKAVTCSHADLQDVSLVPAVAPPPIRKRPVTRRSARLAHA
jgi:hypothetical protein